MNPSAAAARRIGVFGGAFDPPHQGHVQLLQSAIAQLNLDTVLVIPTGEAWHKERGLTSVAHRLAMAQLAFGHLPQVQVDAREVARTGPSYTVDTLTELHAEHPGATFYLLMGQDQWSRFRSWRRPDDVAALAIICVAFRADPAWAQADSKATIAPPLSIAMPAVGASSTAIRSAVARHEGIDGLVFAPVARYIEQHHLYQNS